MDHQKDGAFELNRIATKNRVKTKITDVKFRVKK